MRCYWAGVKQEREMATRRGRRWSWRGKHRTDAAGSFVCSYKSWRTIANKERIIAVAPIHRDGLARKSSSLPHEQGTRVGTVCRECGRLIEYIASHEEWLLYQS